MRNMLANIGHYSMKGMHAMEVVFIMEGFGMEIQFITL